ncbi:hypothetical protein [Pseudomonas leptonychotis]|uniref:Chemotaxis protein CheX n=1 Tax=Pseudomonas leptonychotis TaxID=2448482 RepID=A0A4T1ZXN6_9PSED|nr:hypothetical protein [Pseudomonas leptonychotis]TIH07666.1 hypothetical protein D8779_16070 [Pseudomonas leptonychotis]
MRKANYELESTLYKLMQVALEQTLKSCDAGVPWVTTKVEGFAELQHASCIVLTVSSFKFKIMCLLHLSMDAANRQFVADALGSPVEELQESEYSDYLLEMSNSFCGNLKRHLQSSCPPLGMSTPNFLDRHCFDGSISVQFAHSVHVRAQMAVGAPSLFAASAMVILKNDGDLTLQHYHEHVSEIDSEADSSGELELF